MKKNNIVALNYLSGAIKEISDCLYDCATKESSDHTSNVIYKISTAEKYLKSALERYTNRDAVWKNDCSWLSGNLHTFLRKYDDSPVSVLLYRRINENPNNICWKTFVETLHSYLLNPEERKVKSKIIYNRCMSEVKKLDFSCSDLEYEMYYLLKIWEEGAIHAIEWTVENYQEPEKE